MDRFWLKDYPPGVPADVDVTLYRSLPELMDESFRKYAQRGAFVFMDHPLAYAESIGCRRHLVRGCSETDSHAERAWRS